MRIFGGILLAAFLVAVANSQREQDVNRNAKLHLLQGDILLTPEQQATREATSNPNDPFSPQNAVVRNERSLWRNGIVPFVFDGSLDSRAISAIQEAIAEYRDRTCIRFVQRSNERDYVRFYRGGGCFSYIGRVGGPQDISIGTGCEYRGVVIHEMFHALGRWHEQSRPDRDQFVRINFNNIQSGVESNFETVSSAFVTTQGVPYDLSSIMHYGAYAFSRNRRPTITPVNSGIALRDLGQRNGFSSLDLQHVNALYCGGSSPSSWSTWSSWSGCNRTCNGGTRQRSRTCQGGVSCEGSNIDMQQCNTAACPVAASWGSWSQWSGCSVSCGGGRQSRRRSCVGGNTCTGQNGQFRDCNLQDCPLPASWGQWGSWSDCSATCQGGTRNRRRLCRNGNNCPGADFDTEFCNSAITCTSEPNPSSGEWSQWSQCTRSCDGGSRFRVRMCGGQDCDVQQEICNTRECNPEPDLRGLQHIGCYYVPRFSNFLGLLEGLNEDLFDDPLTRENPVRKCGKAAQAFNFNLFAVSIGYCISGSNRITDYQYVRSAQCADGKGGYTRGYYLMDVYEVTNTQTFQDSVQAIEATPVVATITTEATLGGEDAGSGSLGSHHSSVLAVICGLLVAVALFVAL